VIINLAQEQSALEEKISELESKIAPLQKEIQESRERLFHVEALLSAKKEGSIGPVSGKLSWAALCRQHGWPTGGDSGHRVLQRKDPNLHCSIPHECDYDNRTYP
jgi:hypothetical protein